MGAELFDPTPLPAPLHLRRRHLALILIEQSLTGDNERFQRDSTRAGREVLSYESGSGDSYGLVVAGDEAVLWFFDHESAYSMAARDDDDATP